MYIRSHAGGRRHRIAICRETGGYEVESVHYDNLVQVYRAICDLDDTAPDDAIVRDECAAHRHFGIPSIPYQILQDDDSHHLDPHRPTDTRMPRTSKPPGAATSSSAPEIARPSASKTKAARSRSSNAAAEAASNSKKRLPKASRSPSSNAAVDTSTEEAISPVRTSRGYSERELGGNRDAVARILEDRPVWNDEVVQALLENGALPRLHSATLGHLRESGNHQILCIFVQPNGKLVEHCSCPLGSLWIDYGHHKDVKKLWDAREKLLSNRNRNIR
jgi:hypothetical protein